MSPAPLREKKAVETRAARLDDYAGIAALQTRNGLAARSYESWAALWTGNPARRDARSPLGWVVEDNEGEIRGYLGNVPLEYAFRGRTVRAATPFSWVVDPGYRLHSLDLQRRFVSQKDVDLVVYTTLNEVTEKLLRAFSFSRLTVGTWDTAGFWVTDPLGFSQSVCKAKSLPAALAYPISAAFSATDAWRMRGGSDETFERCEQFDDRFDDFWRELCAENRGALLAVRDRESLEWHFRRALARDEIWILRAVRGGRMVAYAIFDRYDNPEIGLRRIRFTDFQTLKGFKYLLRPALEWAIARCRWEEIHVLENVGCWLDRFGISGTRAPHRRPLQTWLFYYRTRDREFFRDLQDPDVWVPSAFDGDASI